MAEATGFTIGAEASSCDSRAAPGGASLGRKEVTIPISAVTGVDAGIRLNLTKKQVEGLPLAD